MTDHDCFTDQQGHLPCTCSKLMQENSDGTSPHSDTRELVDLALDFELAAFAVGCVIFTVFSLIGFWSAR